MEKFLNNLRQKPKGYREALAFGASAFFAGIIFVGWAMSFFFFGNGSPQASSQVPASPSPWDVLKSQWGEVSAEISNKFSASPVSSNASALPQTFSSSTADIAATSTTAAQ